MVTEMDDNSEQVQNKEKKIEESKPAVKVEKEEEEVNQENKEEPVDNPVAVKTEKMEVEESKESSKPVKRSQKDTGDSVTLYKVKVSGLPRFYSPSDPLLIDFKKMLREELKLDFHYIRSPKKGNSWLYITFTSLEDQKKALNILKRYTWKGRTIIGTLVIADLKRKPDDQSNGTLESKKAKYDIPIEEQMLMSTIPYHSIPYEEQLSKKNEETVSLLKWLSLLTEKRNYLLSGYFDEHCKKNTNGLPFYTYQVRPSPIIDGYRNKCEFRIGKSCETNAVTVGYRVDNQQDGSVDVALPDSLRHLPKAMIKAAKEFEKFIQKTGFCVYENDSVGNLKIMTVRMNKAEQLMLIVTVRPLDLPDEELQRLKKELIEFFTVGEGNSCNVASLFLYIEKEKDSEENKKVSPVEEHIWGSKYLEEEVLGLKLEVTPDFYFQCNTHSAEVLYKAVIELAEADSETTVLDLCCGSGGMGMVLAKQAKEVIGVELMDANVEGAKRLAVKNGLENCEFVQGKIDDVYPSLLEKLKGKKVVPILDPPRAGITQGMIVNLRKLEEAKKLIYVCSNHKLPLKNLLDLATVESTTFAGMNPFVPTKVIPIDVSPHTLRCELVILCERLEMEKLPKPTREPKKVKQNISSFRKRRWSYGGQRRVRSNWRYGPGNFQRSGRGGPPPLHHPPRHHSPPMLGGGGYPFRNGPPGGGQGPFPPTNMRDSLYPPPLRDALYNPPNRNFGPPPYQERDNYQGGGQFGRPFNQGRREAPWNYNGPPERFHNNNNFDYETRYSNFRRDVEAAINSSYRGSRGGPRPLMRGSERGRGRRGRR